VAKLQCDFAGGQRVSPKRRAWQERCSTFDANGFSGRRQDAVSIKCIRHGGRAQPNSTASAVSDE
jgi:hypothetical protein